jgi:hypothetical protein
LPAVTRSPLCSEPQNLNHNLPVYATKKSTLRSPLLPALPFASKYCFHQHATSIISHQSKMPTSRTHIYTSHEPPASTQQSNISTMSLHSTSTSSSSLFNYLCHTPNPDPGQDQHTSPPLHDLEKASEPHDAVPKQRLCPHAAAPSIFKILTIGILFLGITAVVAGMISGDWEASFCITPLLLPFPSLLRFANKDERKV